MLGFLSDFAGRFAGQVIGLSGAPSVYLATFLLLAGLLIVFFVVRISFEAAFIIVSPAVFVLSLGGWLPEITLGAAILLMALFWTGIILAIAGGKT